MTCEKVCRIHRSSVRKKKDHICEIFNPKLPQKEIKIVKKITQQRHFFIKTDAFGVKLMIFANLFYFIFRVVAFFTCVFEIMCLFLGEKCVIWL